MLHPLALDLFLTFSSVCAGAAALACGYFLVKLSKPAQVTVLIITLGFLILVGITLAGIMPFRVRVILSALGGGSVAMSCAALILIGFAWASPKRTLSKHFLGTLVAIVAVVLLIEGGGRLWWRFAADSLWQRTANRNGLVTQSTRWTCSPAAAVMLLHAHGVRASEGEMAYLANTSLFGTYGFDLTRALTEKICDHGWHAELHETSYAVCLSRSKPFVAHIWSQETGGHAIFVHRLTSAHAFVVDPLVGWPAKKSREDFERVWDGTAIWINTGQD